MKFKKQLSRILAAVMCATMVASAMPANLSINAMAASSSSVTESTTVTPENPRMDYIENGNFEDPTKSLWSGTITGFSSWTEITDKSGDNRVGSSSSGNVHNGQYSLCVSGRGDNVYQMVEVIPGVTYELTGYVHLTAKDESNTQEGDAAFYVEGYSQNEVSNTTYMTFNTGELMFSKYKTSGIKLENDTLVRGDWMKFTYTVEAPHDTPYLCVYLGGNARTTYYDDISLCAVVSNEVKDNGGFYNVDPLSKYEISGIVTLGSGFNANDIFSNWTESAPSSAYYSSLLGTGYGYIGNALRVTGTNYNASQKVEVEAGVTYELTGHINLTATASGTMKAYMFGSGYTAENTLLEATVFKNITFQSAPSNVTITDIDTKETVTTMESGKWYQFSRRFTTGTDVKYLELLMRGSGGTALFDNISVCKVETESATPATNLVLNGGFEGADTEIVWEGYDAEGEATSGGRLGLREDGYFSRMINIDENTNRLKLSFTDSTGTSKFTDVVVRRVIEPDRLGVSLNSNFYYTTEETGIATLTPNTVAYSDTNGWTGVCQVIQDGNVIWNQEKEKVDLSKGEVEITFPLEKCNGKDYVFKTTLYVKNEESGEYIEKEVEEWYFDRCYPRPDVLNDDGIFEEEDGDMFHPVFAYHMYTPAEIIRCAEEFGVNVFQLAHGWVGIYESDKDRLIKILDTVRAVNGKVAVCLYFNNLICSAPENIELVEKYMHAFLDEDGALHEYEDLIFAWCMDDEPVGGGVSEDLITAAYEMIRDIDPTRPVYAIDQREEYYPTLIRNADVVAIDNYPYGKWDAMTYIYDSAKYAVKTAETSKKPIYTLLQCWPRGTGDKMDKVNQALYCPSANGIRNMIYQSFMAGAMGIGYYGFDYTDTNDPNTPNMKDTGMAKGIAEFAAKEQDIMFDYFVDKEYVTFNSNVNDLENMRYVSFLRDNKIYMVVLNKKEFESQTVSVPLTGENVKGDPVTIKGFTAEAYAGMLDTSGEPIATETIDSNEDTLDVTLQPGAAVVYIITPKEDIDWGIGVTDITLNQTELSMYVGDEETLQATIAPSDATFPTLSWKSSNPAVATVDQNGKVTAVGKGEATITATSSFHVGPAANCTVTVASVNTGLIENGGFEDFEGSELDNWTRAYSEAYPDRVAPSTAQVYAGESSLYINGSTQSLSQMVNVEPEKKYELTGYVYLNGNRLQLNYYGYQDADKVTSTATKKEGMVIGADASTAGLEFINTETGLSETLPTTGKWYKFSCEVTTSADTEFLDVVLQGKNGGYFDNISLFEVVPPEVSINDVDYDGTLQEAIAVAPAGATLVLLEDVDATETDYIELSNGITLDLNGKRLTTNYFIVYDGNIIDNSEEKTGLLEVAKNQIRFNRTTDNAQIPVYNGTDGYVFANVKHQEQRNSYVGADTFELVFRPSLGSRERNIELLGAGGDAAQISIGIHLEWIKNGEPKEEYLWYKDDAEYSIIVDAYTNDKALGIKASGTSNFQNLIITPVVKSQLNEDIVCYGTNFASNVHKDYNIGVWEVPIDQDWE